MACVLSKSVGIVTILGGGECDISSNTLSAPSLTRTFSADLSSKNWLSQNGFSPIKRISSSAKLRAFGTDSLSSDDEEEEERSRSGIDIWDQFQENKNNTKDEEIEPSQSDVWSSILSEKKKMDTVHPPYVHPLVKHASSLSEKSLEICTESLGSETGCEGFFSFVSSETRDADINKEISSHEETNLVLNVTETKEEEDSITFPNHKTCFEPPRGSFPPPISTLSSQSGSSLHMKTRRDNGRLVLEAVSMPSHKNFSAKRENGRLLLSFSEISNKLDKEDETDTEEHSSKEKEEEDEEAPYNFTKPNGPLYNLTQKPSGPITVHRLAHKPIRTPKTNSKWPDTDEFNTKSDQSTPILHSLPPRQRLAHLTSSIKPQSTVDDTIEAACFNDYDYYWKPINTEALGPKTKTQIQAQNVINKSIGVNSCKQRRSLSSVKTFGISSS